jgi:hypothetical protein
MAPRSTSSIYVLFRVKNSDIIIIALSAVNLENEEKKPSKHRLYQSIPQNEIK